MTDALGRSPAGLLYDGVHQAPADTREWLVLPARMLQPSGGRLLVDFTEELWETAYFDLAELRAVDHPAGVELVANEKMVPPPFPAEGALHRLASLHAAATDERGRDRTEEIAREDGVYLGGLCSDALPGHRRAARSGARAAAGAPREEGHALPDRLDLLCGHFDQRLAVAGQGP